MRLYTLKLFHSKATERYTANRVHPQLSPSQQPTPAIITNHMYLQVRSEEKEILKQLD